MNKYNDNVVILCYGVLKWFDVMWDRCCIVFGGLSSDGGIVRAISTLSSQQRVVFVVFVAMFGSGYSGAMLSFDKR